MAQNPQTTDEALNQRQAQEVVAKYDQGSRVRSYAGPFGLLLVLVAASMSVFHLYNALLGTWDALFMRAGFVSFVLFLGFAFYPARFKGTGEERRLPPVTDMVLMAAGVWIGLYVMINYETICMTQGMPSQADLIMGSIAVLLVLELCRRAVSPILFVICIIFLLYTLFGDSVPGFLSHRGYSFDRLVSHLYLTTEGIFGVTAGVATNYIFLFILFGAFLTRTGTGKFFIDIAVALMGGYSGGPAKVAVFASGLMGTINGSSVANVASTGAFTIPMMKSIGYRPVFAGAVEAAASTGGQLMPPIMGAGAFLMAEIIGISYFTVITAAALPGILYYTGVLVGVHLEAKRTGLEGLPKGTLPSARKIMKERGLLLMPVVAVLFMLLQGYTPAYAAVAGIAATIIVGAIVPTTRVHPRKYWEALVEGPKEALGVCAACVSIGFIVGAATLTGAGLKIAGGIVDAAGGNLLLICFFTMIASLVLGMGIPTTANYLITSTIAAPALLEVGIPPLAAHLFVFYFGIISDLTPPVCLAAMAGGGIAGAPPVRTGVQSFKLAAPAYLIPYVFVYAPQITLVGFPFLTGLQAAFTAILGVICLGISIFGWMFTSVPWWQRVPLFLAAFMLIIPGAQSDVLGIVLLAAMSYLQWRQVKGEKARRALKQA